MLDAITAEVGRRWGNVEELLALLVELLDTWRLAWIRANAKKGTRLPEPITITRPQHQPADTRRSEPARFTLGDLAQRAPRRRA